MAQVIKKIRCPSCASKGEDNTGDNMAVHDDGSQHCFKCSHHIHPPKGHNSTQVVQIDKPRPSEDLLPPGDYRPLVKHGITQDTCEKFGVFVTNYEGYFGRDYFNGPVSVFSYYRHGKIVKQKIKTLDKQMKWLGSGETDPYLFHANSSKGKKLVITEGEQDALAVAQTIGDGPWDVTSLPGGTNTVSKFIEQNYDMIVAYETIILSFDMDSAGRQAVVDFKSEIKEFGKVLDVKLSEKDACDMLVNNKANDLKWAILTAKPEKPKSSTSVSELMDKVLEAPAIGKEWPWQFMTDITFGRRTKELYVIAGDSAVGKTQLVQELVFSVLEQGENVGICSFEQDAEETIQRLVGAKLNKQLHIPGEWWDPVVIKGEAEKFEDKLFLYDKSKAPITLDNIVNTLHYWVNIKKCKFIVIDNLTAMTGERHIDGKRVSENDFLCHVATTLFNLVKGPLDCTLLVIAHITKATISKSANVSTAKPKEGDVPLTAEEMDKLINKPGMDWESGRIPRLGEIYGGSHLPKVSDYIITLGRNRTSEDDTEKRILKLKFLKTRKESSNEGRICKLIYNRTTGRLDDMGS